MKRSRLAVLVLPLLLFIFLAISAVKAQELSSATYKSVNAPPSDILDGTVQLPDPAQHGLHSQSAMLAVSLTAAKDGSLEWSSPIAVDATSDVAFLLLAPTSAQWDLTLSGPDGEKMVATAEATTFGLEGTTYPATAYRFESAVSGMWTASIRAAKGSATEGYLLVGNKGSTIRLHSHLARYETLVSHPLGIVSSLYAQGTERATDQPLSGALQSVELRVRTPDGRTLAVAGGEAADGRATLSFVPDRAGSYSVQVIARGALADGTPVLRTAEHLIAVVEPTLALAAQPVQTSASGTRLTLALPVENVTSTVEVKAGAEVWGTGADGAMAPVAWVGGIVAPSNGTLSLSLDARWIALSGTRAPFELRNVRVQDLDSSVPMSQASAMPMSLGRLPNAARIAVSAPTSEMLMGSRPAGSLVPDAPQAGKLMLVHGYCSGGVWPTSQFSNAVVFQDFSQNRSHDQFAQLIRNQGAAYSSFGVVAHSQGGAASLHLYTYYWSGLDYATGARLIQSVGTPYQGTALAGNLALLGQIFGIGCGTNYDLTYDGAALWLSGIPSWARAKIYYNTTSFTDLWWRYDYCQIASDLLLSDPDDGTTERWAGQLSGANNMGHKTGWCHTVSMRDPAQYNDSSRNANMNYYAAR